ncbi:cytochrome P450 family protein [Nocardiopsis salina]|uniref:cytochrome P450 family protein n=1 Tax=Nocardiopsis salina TaxID=245836 RepID=UPI0003474C9F|nr:cytochrome P450 [Nocardiopsis salina]
MTTATPQPSDGIIDLRDPDVAADPHALVERVRAAGGSAPALFVDQQPARIFVDDEDVRTILSDRRFVMDPGNVPGEGVRITRADALRGLGLREDLVTYLTESLLQKDGVDHVRLRKLVSRTFTVRRVNELRPSVERISADLLAALPGHADEDGVVDLVEHFAYPLPIAVICDLVGVPEQDRPLWRDWSHRLTRFDPQRPEEMNQVFGELIEHIHGMIEQRRKEPHDDLLDALIHARDEDGDRLNGTELVTLIFTLVIAGHETTAHLIGNGTVELLRHPDQLERLRDEPGLVPAAIHEMLRHRGTAAVSQARYATEDIPLHTGTVVRGERAIAVLWGANHDPDSHPAPDRFDITRHHGRPGENHVAFGHGMHYCLGAALARQEGEVAFTQLLSSYPGLSLVEDRPPRPAFAPGALRLEELPVRLGT